MPDTTVKLQDITPVKSTFDSSDQILLINPTGEALISKDDFIDAMPDDAITLIGDITTTGIEGDTVAKQLGALENSKAPAITETTESSAIANFTDGADNMVMHNVVVEINPVQSGSGDPSPSNIRPISGWTGCNVTRTGANVWDEEWELVNNAVSTKNYVPVVPSANYYWKAPAQPSNGFNFYNKEKELINTVYSFSTNNNIIEIPANCYFVKFKMGASSYGTTYNHDISINYPSTDHDYHAYQGSNTVTLSWQTEAGTVYGGTIDVTTGLLTVTHALWTKNTSTMNNNENYPGWSNAGIREIVGSNLSISYANQKMNIGTHFAINTLGTNDILFLSVNDYGKTQTEWIALAQDVQIAVPLATPQTYQLTPQQLMTLLGTNNVWADTGDTTVTYVADTKMFIEKLTMPTEDDMVANQAITSGKYFMIGNSLYLALANIASGAQITIGTNAQRVSLADALNTINS